jgi:hypothetical protein
MQALQHTTLFLFALAFAISGWFMARNPSPAYRFFSIGQRSERGFFVGFVRSVGWIFAILFWRRDDHLSPSHPV